MTRIALEQALQELDGTRLIGEVLLTSTRETQREPRHFFGPFCGVDEPAQQAIEVVEAPPRHVGSCQCVAGTFVARALLEDFLQNGRRLRQLTELRLSDVGSVDA